MESMKKVVVLGAGRSSSSLIQELLNRSESNGWLVAVGDMDLALAQQKCAQHPASEAFEIDPSDNTARDARIVAADLVISMVPAFLHPMRPFSMRDFITLAFASPACVRFNSWTAATIPCHLAISVPFLFPLFPL